MKISVLIAAYQAAPTVARALAGVQAQTHADWEIVVVEDGSHDGTEQIARAASAPEAQAIRYDNLGTNQGVAAARNRLLRLATGDAVAFLDADDWWAPDHLAAGIRELEAGADLVATGVRTFDLASQQTLQELHPPAALATDPIGTLFDESVIITSSSVLLSRRLIELTGEFDRSFSVGEDRDYWIRAAIAGARFAVAPGVTCQYAKHLGSTMSRTQLVAAQEVRFYEKHFQLAAVPPARRRQHLAHCLINQGRLLREDQARASVRQLWRAWRLVPSNLGAAGHLLLSGGHAVLGS
jgi:glycosyltransferase involved in cell wall biosynthesis